MLISLVVAGPARSSAVQGGGGGLISSGGWWVAAALGGRGAGGADAAEAGRKPRRSTGPARVEIASGVMASSEASVQVVVRIRPLNAREQKSNTTPIVTTSTERSEVTVIKGSGKAQVRNTFKFANVFGSFTT